MAMEPLSQTRDQLKTLSIFYYVLGGICVLFSCFPLIYVIVGQVVFTAAHIPATFPAEACPGHPGAHGAHGAEGAAIAGTVFTLIGVIGMLIAWTMAALSFITGKFLSSARHHTFCLVMAAIACLMAPMGTVLGVFTIIILMKDEAKQLFAQGRDEPAA
jgi:hypothetical protein